MAVTTTVNVERSPFTYRELERGVGLWRATGSVTGGAGADVQEVLAQFNPDSRDNYQPFVTLTHVGVRTHTAAAVGNAQVTLQASSWERTSAVGSQVAITPVSVVQTTSATNFAGAWFGHYSAGRILKGTTGQIQVQLQEVNTMVAIIHLEGLVSEHPIVSRWWLAA